MNYLDQVYFDNSLRSYIAVLATIIIALITKRFFSRLIASLIYGLVKKIAQGVEKKKFVALVIRPLENFIFLLIAVFAIQKLIFPEDFKIQIYNIGSHQVLEGLVMAIVIFYFIR